MHAGLRVPLHLPGHHGLEWMALLAFASVGTQRRWAATGVGASALVFAYLPVWGLHDPLAPLGYLVAAGAFDLLCRCIPRRWRGAVAVSAAGALAFAGAGLLGYFSGPHGWASGAPLGIWIWAYAGFGLAGTYIGARTGAWTVRRTGRMF
ncbi:MAG TPA: hypothetical protein VKA50_04040 [Gammaproteobacteria bacterium]|nr:hypothetical protein [Gammaproteobacteria bacterium]